MTWTQSTSSLWARVPTSLQVAILAVCLPGMLSHELTHLVLGRRWAADATLDLDRMAVDLEWSPSTSWWRVVVQGLAPLLVGWLLGALAAAYAVFAGVRVPVVLVPVLAWAVFQWAVYTLPFWGDLVSLPPKEEFAA